MLLWVILAAMTAAALAAVLAPLRRSPIAEPAPTAGPSPTQSVETAPALAVYRDQLTEIDADLERGLITDGEARAARVEVQRRMLRLDQPRTPDLAPQGGVAPPRADASSPIPSTNGQPVNQSASRWSPAGLVIAGLVPLVAVLAYAGLGAPHLPDQPLAARRATPPERSQIEILVARVEEQLRTNPDDGRGWEVIAPVYTRMGRDEDARNAWRQAMRVLGPSTARLRSLVESAIAAARGQVDAEARAALESLRKADPTDPVARFWLAMAMKQDGQQAAATAALQALLADAPTDAPWRVLVVEQLAELGGGQPSPTNAPAGTAPAPAKPLVAAPSASAPAGSRPGAPPGPTAEQITAAREMTPEAQAAMISGMVDGLAARLAREGRDIDGWLRLLQSYGVLGRRAEAVAALASARTALAGDTKALTRLAAAAKTLGLEDR